MNGRARSVRGRKLRKPSRVRMTGRKKRAPPSGDTEGGVAVSTLELSMPFPWPKKNPAGLGWGRSERRQRCEAALEWSPRLPLPIILKLRNKSDLTGVPIDAVRGPECASLDLTINTIA
jgi:hypothetical protein